MGDSKHNPTCRAGLPAGYDEDDPYADVNIDEYPEWWRRNIEEFRRYDLRPYRPPRFVDGKIAPPVISNLEAELNETIRLRVVDPEERNEWEVLVGEKVAATVDRYRHSEGYSVYDVKSEVFECFVRDASEA